MVRRRGPLRFFIFLANLAVLAGLFFYTVGPLAAKKEAYRKGINEVQRQMMTERTTAETAMDAFNNIEDPADKDWEALATSSDTLAKDYEMLLAKASGLEAPRDSRVAHDHLLSSIRINSQIYSNVAKAARAHDRSRMRDAVVDGNRLTQDIGGEGH